MEERRQVTPVAGIGASAGGLDVFRQLLGALPRDHAVDDIVADFDDNKRRDGAELY